VVVRPMLVKMVNKRATVQRPMMVRMDKVAGATVVKMAMAVRRMVEMAAHREMVKVVDDHPDSNNARFLST
jgi:hypothetical protein